MLVAGRVAQVATPAEIFRRPATVEVARLVGDPPMNLLAGRVVDEAGTLRFRHDGFGLSLPRPIAASLERRVQRGRRAGLRPAEIRVVDGAGATRGEVWIWEPLGKYGILTVRLGPDVVKIKSRRPGGGRPARALRSI